MAKWLSSGLSVLAMAAAAPGLAQVPTAADTLSMHLRTIAAQPRNVSALLGAGRAALEVGDPNAAIGFFARAEEVDSRSGAARAGLASALVSMERADDALKLFGEAVSLGVPESEIAKDRGLAYDLRGDPQRAQRDYALALRRGSDDEVTRRYALSLGISGERERALQLLKPLLYKKDQGAWRAQAFVLAMTGDLKGAEFIAGRVMPASMAGTMTPFLTRLSTLNAADRAHAVNFGTMPATGQSFASVRTGDPFRPIGGANDGRAGDALIPTGDPFGPRAGEATPAKAAQPVSREPRRRPDRQAAAAFVAPPALAATPRTSVRIAAAAPVAQTSVTRAPQAAEPVRSAMILPPPNSAAEAPRVVVAAAAPAIATPTATPAFEIAPAAARIAPVQPAAPATRLAAVAVPGSRLAAILSGIEVESESRPAALPDTAALRAQRLAAQRKAAEAAKATAAKKAAELEKAAALAEAKKNPPRVWVQIATGANTAALPATWKRIRDANGKALKDQSAYSAPFKATNRLLVGPMKSAADARALVNTLAKGGLQATTWSSEAGQEVGKLASR